MFCVLYVLLRRNKSIILEPSSTQMSVRIIYLSVAFPHILYACLQCLMYIYEISQNNPSLRGEVLGLTAPTYRPAGRASAESQVPAAKRGPTASYLRQGGYVFIGSQLVSLFVC